MAEIPKSRTYVPDLEAERLRLFLHHAELTNARIAGARVARREDAGARAGLLAHENIGPRIYTMPNPINRETMTGVIDDHLMQRASGDGILFVSFNKAGEASAYFAVQLWPQWSIAKLGGAVKAERQGRGFAGARGLAAVEGCFDQLGVARIGETKVRDNDRSIRLLSRLGFVQMGEVAAVKPDGAQRTSPYWKLEREAWDALGSVRRTG